MQPPAWPESIHGANMVLGTTTDPRAPTLSISALTDYEGMRVEDIFNGLYEYKIDFKSDCTKMIFASAAGYDCPTGSYLHKRAIFFYQGSLPFAIFDNIDNETSRQVVRSFLFR